MPLGNAEKFKTFSVPIGKGVAKIDKDGNESVVAISYKIKFIDSARFVGSSLPNLLNKLQTKFRKLNVEIVIFFLNMKASRII